MTTPDELQRAVERLKNAARNNDGTLIDKDYGEVFVCVSDLHLANEILSERAELLATVERMRGEMAGMETRLRRWEPRVSLDLSVACAITRAALPTGEATPNAGEKG